MDPLDETVCQERREIEVHLESHFLAHKVHLDDLDLKVNQDRLACLA